MDILRIFAILFGLVFIAAGVAGFMPMFVTDDKLLGLFMVDQTHNLVHVISGAIALLCAAKEKSAKWYFIIFGIIYAIVTVLGFMGKEDMIMMHFNMADNGLHLAIAVVALFLGFFIKAKQS